jgi:quercetin dioxygenase-like cupin family protein
MIQFVKQKIRRCAMKTVKQLLFVALTGLLMFSVAIAQEKASQTAAPGPSTAYQAKFPITLQGGEYDLQTIIMDFPQGAGVPKHIHGGYVLVTVLNGEMTLKEKGSDRIIKTGESWTENPSDLHSVVNAGATPARVVVNILLPKGAEATTIIKQ